MDVVIGRPKISKISFEFKIPYFSHFKPMKHLITLTQSLQVKAFFLLCFLLASTTSFAQNFGYVVQTTQLKGSATIKYFGPVIDLSGLDCASVSRKNEYGTAKSLVALYSECLKKRTLKINAENNINLNIDGMTCYIKKPGQYNGCIYGNEKGCFMTKEEAQQMRDKAMKEAYADLKCNVVDMY